MTIARALMVPATLEMTDRDFEILTRLIREQSGINLAPHKRTLLRVRLARRLRALGLTSFKEYCRYVTDDDTGRAERIHMLDAVSTNVTEFFREAAHFEYLKRHFFPRWGREPSIRILSAGCSSGEEPYSLAICGWEALGDPASFKVRVTGVDISTRALARARTGIYPLEKVKGMPIDRLRAFFLRGSGGSEGLARVAPAVQAMVKFLRLNLTEPLPFDRPFHAIFCRNVAIYFDRATQKKLFSNLYDVLAPGGLLCVGHSESMSCWENPFRYLQPTVYERPGPDDGERRSS